MGVVKQVLIAGTCSNVIRQVSVMLAGLVSARLSLPLPEDEVDNSTAGCKNDVCRRQDGKNDKDRKEDRAQLDERSSVKWDDNWRE